MLYLVQCNRCVPYDTERSHNEFETYEQCELLLVKEEASKASRNDPIALYQSTRYTLIAV